MPTRLLAVSAAVVAVCLPPGLRAADDAGVPRAGLRRPVAIAVIDERVCVANRRSGTVSILDATGTIRGEHAVGSPGGLSDLAAIPGSTFLVATDDARHEARLLALRGDELQVVGRQPVARHPVSVAVDPDGQWVSIASLWSRRATILRLEGNGGNGLKLSSPRVIDLPFAPRVQCAAAAETGESRRAARLLVADAFGGRIGVINPQAAALEGEVLVPGHNLRGLALHPPLAPHQSSSRSPLLLASHQVLNSETSTTHEHVFWGGVIGNRLRALELPAVMAARRDAPAGSVDVLGRPGAAAGDPGAVVVTPAGATLVALSGINEVAIRRRPEDVFSQRPVGRRPLAIATSRDARTAWVVNSLDDTVSVIDIPRVTVERTIPLGPPVELSLADRGEQHFFDARLSLDGWYSCHSCHTDGHTNGRLNDNLGDDYFGAPKRIPSVLGTGDTAPWAWNGGSGSLERQLDKSLRVTMQAEPAKVADETIQSLKAYLATLAPPPGIDAAREVVDEAATARGRAVFRTQGCADCHAPETYTTSAVFDVGLRDERGLREFNPPSLRGVSQRAPYFHDNRAADLRDVVEKHRHGVTRPLSGRDLDGLLRFLQQL